MQKKGRRTYFLTKKESKRRDKIEKWCRSLEKVISITFFSERHFYVRYALNAFFSFWMSHFQNRRFRD